MQQIYLSKKSGVDNKYPNDSSVPLHPERVWTRGPNVERRQYTQRSKQQGVKAARTAWLNGAGDFLISCTALQAQPITGGENLVPQPAKPGSHSVEKAKEGAGVYLGPCIIHMQCYGSKTSTKERPQVPSVPTCFQSIIDGNTTPYTFAWFTGFYHCCYNKGHFQSCLNISKHGASGRSSHRTVFFNGAFTLTNHNRHNILLLLKLKIVFSLKPPWCRV